MAVFGSGGDKKHFSGKVSLAFHEVDEYRRKLRKKFKKEESEIMYACEICDKKASSPWAKCSKCGGNVTRMEQAEDVSEIINKQERDMKNFGKEGGSSSAPTPPKPQKRKSGKRAVLKGLNHEGEEDDLDLEDVAIRMVEREDLMDFKELVKKSKKKIIKKSSKKVPTPKKKVNVKKRSKGSRKK